MKKTIDTKAVKHLKGDIAGYKKQRKELMGEIGEDKGLIRAIKKSKARKK